MQFIAELNSSNALFYPASLNLNATQSPKVARYFFWKTVSFPHRLYKTKIAVSSAYPNPQFSLFTSSRADNVRSCHSHKLLCCLIFLCYRYCSMARVRDICCFLCSVNVACFRKVYKKCHLLVKKIKTEIGFSCRD